MESNSDKIQEKHPKISSLSKDMFPSLLSEIKEAVAPKEKDNLISGFRAAGIFPLNRKCVKLPHGTLFGCFHELCISV